MVKAACLTVGLALAFSFSGCGSDHDAVTDTDTATVMPDVLGLTLDVALSDIKRAGFENEVEVLGGGIFGIIDESNWKVCDQLPAAGQRLDAPRLTVDRSCGDSTTESTSPPSATTPPTDAPSTETSQRTETTATASKPPTTTQENLTAENSEDLAAILREGNYCDAMMESFATVYKGRTIEFDGNVAALAHHGDYTTRFDFAISPGDYSETSVIGPAFQFKNVNFLDLQLTGSNVPDSIGPGANLHVVARVEGYDPVSCLFFLEPVATQVR